MNLIKELIAISSLSGEEEAIQNYIKTYFANLGIQSLQVGGNILVKIPGKDKRKCLVFNAHVDTVPAGNKALWHHPPLKPTWEKDRLYGLGASDEKAGVAALMLLIKSLCQTPPACDTLFMFVVNEEVDGSGTKNTLEWWQKYHAYPHKAAVLVEPTGLETIELGHKGNAFIKLVVSGDSGHGSQPGKVKVNSVLKMARILSSLEHLAAQWTKKYKDGVLGTPTIGIGTSILAGSSSSPNKFADTCIATMDIRTIPSMHHQVIDEIKAHINDPLVEVNYLYPPAGWGITHPADPLVKAATGVIPHAGVETSLGSTDQCFFTSQNIPAIILGPGEPECIHKPNEYCYPEKINQAVEVYQKLIQTWSQLVK